MKYNLAQINIAKFRLPQDDPTNADFVNNLDRVNALAEAQPGFIWRFTGDGNDALDIHAFNDPHIAVNMSVWSDIGALADFVYKDKDHTAIMRRRKEWFEKMDFYMALWWIEAGREPTVEEAKLRLELLRLNGPTYSAFTFRRPFAAPSGAPIKLFAKG